MKITPLELEGLVLVELKEFSDSRGFFMERFSRKAFEANCLPSQFVQDNHSRSLPGVLRGLHYQHDPPQGKLVGVIRGRIWDVAVDIRKESKTYGKYFGVELNDENGRLLWIPAGFAHGFCVLGDEPADVYYKLDQPYNGAGEGTIRWDDPTLGIDWPVEEPVLSARDEAGLPFGEGLK